MTHQSRATILECGYSQHSQVPECEAHVRMEVGVGPGRSTKHGAKNMLWIFKNKYKLIKVCNFVKFGL